MLVAYAKERRTTIRPVEGDGIVDSEHTTAKLESDWVDRCAVRCGPCPPAARMIGRTSEGEAL